MRAVKAVGHNLHLLLLASFSATLTYSGPVSSQEQLQIRMTVREAACLVDIGEAYAQLTFDPVVFAPQACPHAPFAEVDFRKLAQNNIENKRKAWILSKRVIDCILRKLKERDDLPNLPSDQLLVVSAACEG